MLWTDEDLDKLKELLFNKVGLSTRDITMLMGYGYNVDDVSGVCAALLSKGDSDMGEKRIDVEEFWRLVDERRELKEIAKHFGVSIQSVHKRISKGRPKAAPAANENKKENEDMKYMKWDAEKVEQMLAMKAEGCSAKEIADVFGCSEQSIYDKIKNLKALNGGKIPQAHLKHKHTVADVTPYKPEVEDEKFEEILKSVDEGKTDGDTTEYDRIPVKAEAATETPTDTLTSAQTSKPDRLYGLMIDARCLAIGRGFEPNHIRIDMDEIRSEIIISGKGNDGKVHEIQYSVTDPIYFEKSI